MPYTHLMPSLYTRYRPKQFSQLVGQNHITKLLKAELSKSLAGHAYLFIGPRGTGKTTTARILAKALNCTDLSAGEPCGACASCIAFDEGKFIDLIEIDAASNRGIDEIRDLKEKIEYNPSMGKQKVYIIDEVHMLTKEAFNALLKTLEEPPSYVTFILATTEPQKVPATILSRCEKFEFKLGGSRDLSQALKGIMEQESVTVEKKAMDLLVSHAGGSYRDAVSLLDTIVASSGDKELTEEDIRASLGLPDSEVVETYIEALAAQDLSRAIESLEEIFARGTNISQFIKAVVLTLRDFLIDRDRLGQYSGAISQFTKSRLTECVKILLDAYNAQKYAFDHRLPLQLATAQLITEGGEEVLPIASPKKEQGESVSSQKKVAPVVEKISVTVESVIPENEPVVQKEAPVAVVSPVVGDNTLAVVKKKKKLKKKKAPITGKQIPFEQVTEMWERFTREVQKENRQLFTFVMAANPSGMQFDPQLQIPKIEVKVPFDFHKKQIENPKNQKFLSDTAVKVYGTPMQFVCIISKEEIVFKKSPSSVSSAGAASPMATPTIDTVKVDIKPKESALESAFDSVLGADVESL